MNSFTVILAFLSVLIFAMIIGLIVLLSAIRRHNITMHLKEPVNDNFIYHKQKARLMVDSEGQEFYKTLKKINGKKYFPIPQSNKSVHVDSKGKKHVFGYLSPHGEVVYAIDDNENLFTDKKYVEKLQPFTSNQRALFVSQYKKSLEDAGFNWRQNLPIIVGAITLVIIMVISMVVVKDLYQNNQKLTDKQLEITDKQGEILTKYVEIEQGIQEIKQEVTQENDNGVTP